MTIHEILLFAAAVSSIVAARWNSTATALVIAFFIIQIWWFAGGDVLNNRGTMFLIDFAVVVWIGAKAILRGHEDDLLRYARHVTPCDRLILALFIFGTWPIYLADISEYQRWYALWIIALAQFILADIEAFIDWRRAKASQVKPDNPSSGMMRVAWAGGGDNG